MAHTVNKTTSDIHKVDREAVEEGVNQAGIGIILTLAGVIGTWSLACMISGVVYAGGIGQAARAWVSAVTGM